MVNPGSWFIQTQKYYRPWCYIPSFKVIGPVDVKKIFKVLSIFSIAAILVTWPGPLIQTISPFPMRPHMKLALNGQAVSEKMFEFFDHDDHFDDNGRRSMRYTISSPCKPDGSGELKKGLTYFSFSNFSPHFPHPWSVHPWSGARSGQD